jgi:alpha-ketoglutarate-dependent taurine dioxygenase
MSEINSLESISAIVADDLKAKGWSFLSTDIDPEDRAGVHNLFQAMNRVVALNSSIQPETTTLAPRDNSRILATTREGMSYHTDNVYLDDPCQSVALFCTVQATEGGGNTLVNAIDVAKTLPDEMVDELKLAQWSWMNPAANAPSGEYAVLDEAEENIRWWRMSLVTKDLAMLAIADAFEDAISNSFERQSVLMQPGDILVTDNTRVVHNREAFKGSRHLYRARFW